MKSSIDVETLKLLTKESLAANLDYHQKRIVRLRREVEEIDYQYRMAMSVYVWKLETERRMKDGQ